MSSSGGRGGHSDPTQPSSDRKYIVTFKNLENDIVNTTESSGGRGGKGINQSHPTLGQLADKVQAKAKAEAAAKGFNSDEDNLDDDDDDVNTCTPGQEQTGRWTREEHSLFLDAIKKYGKVCSHLVTLINFNIFI